MPEKKIAIKCKHCNQRLFDYVLQGNENEYILQGIRMKCTRCKRILIFNRYTEKMIKDHIAFGDCRV